MQSGPWNVRRAVLADAGPLYAAADRRDQYHSRARDELLRLNRGNFGVVVARPTFMEAYSLVLRRFGPRRSLAWMSAVSPGIFLLDPVAEDFDAAVDLLRGFADQPMTMFDAVVAALARRLDLPVWTFDHHFDLMRVSVWR